MAGEAKPKRAKPWNKENLQALLISELRRLSYRWLPRKDALRAARRSRGNYECKECGPPITYKKQQIDIDHIDPVIDPETGFIGFDEYITRLFCGIDNFQIMCKTCHKLKTANENSKRGKKNITKPTKLKKRKKTSGKKK